MEIKNLLPILFLTLLLTGCSEEKKPKVIYAGQEQQTEKISQNSTQGIISDLPIQIDSTNYLIHPVGYYEIYERESRYFGSSSSGLGSFSFTREGNSDTYTGDLTNLKFQQLESDTFVSLTNKDLRISSFSFLRAIFENTGKEYLLYEVNDTDSNNDGEMDYNDINTLYISSINGENFRKIGSQYQELIDWKTISNMNRIYFRSIEDTNKNGEFEKEDLLHYFYLDFDLEELNVVEYFPV